MLKTLTLESIPRSHTQHRRALAALLEEQAKRVRADAQERTHPVVGIALDSAWLFVPNNGKILKAAAKEVQRTPWKGAITWYRPKKQTIGKAQIATYKPDEEYRCEDGDFFTDGKVIFRERARLFRIFRKWYGTETRKVTAEQCDEFLSCEGAEGLAGRYFCVTVEEKGVSSKPIPKILGGTDQWRMPRQFVAIGKDDWAAFDQDKLVTVQKAWPEATEFALKWLSSDHYTAILLLCVPGKSRAVAGVASLRKGDEEEPPLIEMAKEGGLV